METNFVLDVEKRKLRLRPLIDKALKGDRLIPTAGMQLEDWLVIRQMLGLGGSEVPTVLGLNEYMSPFQLWKGKVGDEIEVIENKFTWWGIELEAPISRSYEKLSGRTLIEDPYIRIHPKYNNLFVNIDRIIADNSDSKGAGVFEAKSTVGSVYRSWSTKYADFQGIPPNYFAQVQHELSVSGLKWAVLCVLILDQREIKNIPIERDDAYIEKQNFALNAWWNAYVVNVVPPPMDAADYSFIEPIPETSVEIDEEIEKILPELIDKKDQYKNLKVQIDELSDKVKTFIGDNEGLTQNGKIIATYKMIKKKEYLVKAHTERQLRFKKEKE